ncbi:hypothetical protein D3C81_1572320 [compost metagenome]
MRLKHCIRILVFKRLIFIGLKYFGSPFIRFVCTCNKGIQHFENRLNIANDRNISGYVLADFRRVYIDVRNFGQRSESIKSSSYAVIKPRSDINKQVCILNRLVGRIGSVHTRHSHPQLMSAWECS